ncbi:MAG TPA: F0F1 ATP synthase subunit A [Methylomirabilota bacterium]|nr:F0F1 ATP synthase subunit A [Methylomirabilota bacterium]
MLFAIPPLVAEPIFHIANFPVTNAYINSCMAVLFFFIMGLILKNRTALVPKGIQNAAEGALEFLLKYIDQVTHDRRRSLQFLPIVGGIFLFILFSNYLGLLPGTGSIGRNLLVEGHVELVPFLRSANSDLNLTVAMAVFAVFFSHILGVVTIGFFKYTNKFIKLGDLYKSFSRGPIAIMTAAIEFGVGLLEIVSEVAKLVSLSFRLFGNIFAGEVLLTIMASLFAYFVPLPFMFLELIVGLIQAVVFSMLTLVYLTMATAPIVEHAHESTAGATEIHH